MARAWDPGKEGRETGPIHPGSGRKRKRDRDDKTDPIFISRTRTAGLCVLLGSGQGLLKKYIFLILRFHFATCSTPTVSRGGENIKVPERDQR